MSDDYTLFTLLVASTYGSAGICQYLRVYSEKIIDENESWNHDVETSSEYIQLAKKDNAHLQTFNVLRQQAKSVKPRRGAWPVWTLAIIALLLVVHVSLRKIIMGASCVEASDSLCIITSAIVVILKQYIQLTDNLFIALPLIGSVLAYYYAWDMQVKTQKYKDLWFMIKKEHRIIINTYFPPP
ncbi:MAG: hypothetical protein HQL44_08780 [Alphaproteobacteria bacterium]|nr:hypothetical protein [Alphaproteobacteria bacterium]